MLTKTVRSRFNHEVGDKVEGCTIIERIVVAQPVPAEQRRGIYDYIVEVPPTAAKEIRKRATRPAAATTARQSASPEDYTRATPDEMGAVIRRLPSR
jgi:23S rRNA maturation mini-RNase III